MAVTVYAWPPVCAKGAEWTVGDTVQRSQSLLTGRRYVSRFQRSRRMASLVVSGIRDDGAGYMEALKVMLRGGENLVRLVSYPINHGPSLDVDRESIGVEWTEGGVDLNWTEGASDLNWYSSAFLNGLLITAVGGPAVRVQNGPPMTLIARPGEFISIGDETRLILRPSTTDFNGAATILVDEQFSAPGPVTISDRDTGVFEALSIPRAVRPARGDWTYSWEFREVFEDEVPGGFNEVNRWP